MRCDARKPVFGVLQKTKAQTSLRSLISSFVIRLLASTISRHAMSVISIFKLVSVAEETVLSIALSETTKTGFLTSRPK